MVYLAILLAGALRRNYNLNRQISDLRAETTKLTDERDELQFKIQYYKTDAYKEKEARAKLGLQAPGEQVLILPATPENQAATAKHQAPTAPKSNLRQWWQFLFG